MQGLKFLELFCAFFLAFPLAKSYVGKCTSRNLFRYGGFKPVYANAIDFLKHGFRRHFEE